MQKCRILFFLFVLFFPLPVQAVLIERVVAVVNGEIITLSDVQVALQFHLTDVALEFSRPIPPIPPIPEEERKTFQKKALEQLIDRKLLLVESRKFNIQTEGVSPDEIQKETNRIQSFLTPEGYNEALKRWVISETDLIRKIREKITVEKFLNFRIQFFVVVSPDTLQKYYQEHQAEYSNRSFEEVSGEIEKLLSTKEEERMLDEYLGRLRGQTVIQVNPL